MSSSFTAPYNVTITNDSPTISYFPYRDGPATDGWNLTCTNSVEATWVPHSFCAGTSSHRTTYVGASLLIEFEGTAAYLYGEASAGSLVIELDGQISDSSPGNPSTGLLSKTEGLAFGKHRLFLNVTQPTTISFWEAVLSVGVGKTNSGPYNLRNRTLAPFTQTSDGLSTLNPQFTYTGSWYTNVPGTIGTTGVVYPRQHTNQAGAYMTFNLNQTSAFFIYGLINFDLGTFSVTLTPPSDLGSPVTAFYNSQAHWVSLDRVMYWASGLDRDKEYSIKITNLGQNTTPWWDFSHIDIIDAGSTPVSGGLKGKHEVPVGTIGGAAAGAVVLFLLLLVGFLRFRKGRRSKLANTKTDVASEGLHPFGDFIPSTAQNVPYNPYDSTPYESVPAPPGSPGVYNPLRKPLLYTSHPGVQPTQFNNIAPPVPPSSAFQPPQSPPPPSFELSSPGLSYQPSESVSPSWNGAEPSNRASSSQKGPARQSGGRRVVQEEDAGTLSPAEENVVRLPPDYKDVWNQSYT